MISFNVEIKGFKVITPKRKKDWLKNLSKIEGFKLKELNYIFVSDEALLAMNKEYLNHDTLTDIITFDNSEKEKEIEGDIFISMERIIENAEKYKVESETELIRVMAHGLLHLCGYLDKKATDVAVMREKENYYIDKYGEF
jgi:probable rRNA maturation factor